MLSEAGREDVRDEHRKDGTDDDPDNVPIPQIGPTVIDDQDADQCDRAIDDPVYKQRLKGRATGTEHVAPDRTEMDATPSSSRRHQADRMRRGLDHGHAVDGRTQARRARHPVGMNIGSDRDSIAVQRSA